MQMHDNRLRAALKDIGTMVRETASRSEAGALQAVDRAEAALAGGASHLGARPRHWGPGRAVH